MAALCVCAALAAGLSLYPNKLLELRIPNGCAYSHLPRLEAALATKNVEALLLIVEDGENDQDDAAMLATLPAAERIALLEREASIREQLRAAAGSMPVIAVSTSSVLEGACAGLVLAAAHRIMTERTTLCLHGTRFGLLASGLSRVSAIVPDDKRSVAMAVALGAMQCNVHDAERLQLARFVPSTEIPELLAELRCAPAAFIDVPLSRRCQSTPDQYANVFVDSSLIQVTLDEIFGDRERGSAAEVLARLETQAARARALIEMSYSRHTRECAEQALRAIEEASSALDPRMSSPSALAATVALMRVLWAPPQPGQPPPAELERFVNAWLATRDDFGEGLRAWTLARSAERRAARWGPPRALLAALPKWQPARLDKSAVEVAERCVEDACACADDDDEDVDGGAGVLRSDVWGV